MVLCKLLTNFGVIRAAFEIPRFGASAIASRRLTPKVASLARFAPNFEVDLSCCERRFWLVFGELHLYQFSLLSIPVEPRSQTYVSSFLHRTCLGSYICLVVSPKDECDHNSASERIEKVNES